MVNRCEGKRGAEAGGLHQGHDLQSALPSLVHLPVLYSRGTGIHQSITSSLSRCKYDGVRVMPLIFCTLAFSSPTKVSQYLATKMTDSS